MGTRGLVWSAAFLALAAVAAPHASAEPGPSISEFLAGPTWVPPSPPRWTIASLLSTTQDAITEDEYNRLTGVRKRIGVGVEYVQGMMNGPDAGSFRVRYSDTFLTSISYADILEPLGYGVGGHVTLIVAPCYSVLFGGSYLSHAGKTFEGNTFTSLVRIPFYLALRLNAPLSLSYDRWFDYENPEFNHGLIPYVQFMVQGTWWNAVKISGAALPSYEPSRDYFVSGLYPEVGATIGAEIRFGGGLDGIALSVEGGLTYQVIPPQMSRYFSMDPTSRHDIVPGAPYESFGRASLTYYFGSGRIFRIESSE